MISEKLQDGYLLVRLSLLSLAGKDGSFPIPSRFPSSENKDTIALLRDDEGEVKLSLHYGLGVFVWGNDGGAGGDFWLFWVPCVAWRPSPVCVAGRYYMMGK
jgi:hypothetical protein